MTQDTKTLKTVVTSLTSVKILYIALGHITQKTSAENLLSIAPKLTEKACKN